MDGAHWQRWTIEEVAEELARMLVAGAEEPRASELARTLDTDASPEATQEAVTRVEEHAPDELWTEEEQAYLSIELLEPFVRLRSPVPGLPDPRPIREGDVFWVVLPTTDLESTLVGLTPAQVVASADQLDIRVWDITAAARQRAKVASEAALRAGSKLERDAGPDPARLAGFGQGMEVT